MENVVALWPDRLGGENGLGLYLLEEAFELTDSVRLRDEAGLVRSALCLILSMLFASNGVRRTVPGGSRSSGGSCRRLGDIVCDRLPSAVPGRGITGIYCTFATIAGFSRSYCWTECWGPRVNRVAVGP
jgi:hypothetical protein